MPAWTTCTSITPSIRRFTRRPKKSKSSDIAAEGSLSDLNPLPQSRVLNKPVLVGLIDLCSTYSATPVSAAELRKILRARGDLPVSVVSSNRRSWTRLNDDARRDVVARYQ